MPKAIQSPFSFENSIQLFLCFAFLGVPKKRRKRLILAPQIRIQIQVQVHLAVPHPPAAQVVLRPHRVQAQVRILTVTKRRRRKSARIKNLVNKSGFDSFLMLIKEAVVERYFEKVVFR